MDGATTTGDRTLAYATFGDHGGTPVFSLHGTPGSRLRRYHDEQLYVDLGVRLITYDRPGYGGSTRLAGRSVADCAADVEAIADALRVERFAVTGRSGGGPHALAVAAVLPDRVTRVAAVVSVAPYDAPGLDWVDGMDPMNVREHDWAVEGEAALAAGLEGWAAEILQQVATDPAADFGIAFSEADRSVLAERANADLHRQTFEEAFRAGVWGWVDDSLAFVRPWGFEVGEIQVPAQVVYGKTDVLVPVAHGAWLAANVPGAEVVVEGTGHLGDLVDPAIVTERLRWLTGVVRGSG